MLAPNAGDMFKTCFAAGLLILRLKVDTSGFSLATVSLLCGFRSGSVEYEISMGVSLPDRVLPDGCESSPLVATDFAFSVTLDSLADFKLGVS